MKPLAPNTLLQNRYLIVQLIGKGGMGEVYMAVDQRLGSAIALKRTFFSDDEMLGTAFEREARTLARLRHPVLPKVSDHFTEKENQFLVMEHISGDDLAKRLEITNKPFPLNWVLFWADQLLDALAYLHSHEPPIVHRDIKPQNLKLTDENHIVLLDFGLAKNSVGNAPSSSTTGGSIVGYTPHYAPMEQIRGTGTDPRSDIYSFSATFYQLLTNAVPPDAITRADAVINGTTDPTKPLYEINAEVPRAISEVILKGMSLGMDHRYQAAREMQKALREAYSQIQTQMAAQTMAFNAADIQGGAAPVQPFSTNVAPPSNPVPSAKTIPTAYDSVAGMSGINSADILTPPMDAPPPPLNVAPPTPSADASGFKTEVIPADLLPRPEDYKTPTPATDFSSAENQNFDSLSGKNNSFEPVDDFSDLRNDHAPEEDFDPNATIAPLVSFGNAASAPSSVPDYGSANDNYNSRATDKDDFAPENDFRSVEKVLPPPVAAAPVAEKRAAVSPASVPAAKSGGKSLAVVGGGIALLVLVIGGIGAWFALSGGSSATAKPSPTPVTDAIAVPTYTPTAEPTLEAVSNSNTNSDITSVTPEAADNTNSRSTDARAEKTPAPNVPAPTNPGQQRQTPAPRAAAEKTPPPVKKPTPPKASRTDVF